MCIGILGILTGAWVFCISLLVFPLAMEAGVSDVGALFYLTVSAFTGTGFAGVGAGHALRYMRKRKQEIDEQQAISD